MELKRYVVCMGKRRAISSSKLRRASAKDLFARNPDWFSDENIDAFFPWSSHETIQPFPLRFKGSEIRHPFDGLEFSKRVREKQAEQVSVTGAMKIMRGTKNRRHGFDS